MDAAVVTASQSSISSRLVSCARSVARSMLSEVVIVIEVAAQVLAVPAMEGVDVVVIEVGKVPVKLVAAI